MKRTELKSRYRNTGPTDATIKLVVLRDHRQCAKCGGVIRGHRGWDWSVGHRRPRGAGGDRRAETNLTGNLILLHGTGTWGCHGEVESERTTYELLGLIVSKFEPTPAAVPITHAVHGRVLLDDEGGWTPCVSS